MGPAASDQGHTDCEFGCDCGRYVEIWNLVFMQFDRDASGKLTPLPKPSIDTGAGLERVAAVLQGVISNYETDLFTELTRHAATLIGVQNQNAPVQTPSLRIIADHSRAATFLIGDGVLPSNEGRGYVLRKIIRRAIRHGRLNGATQPFLWDMVYAVANQMKDAYPEIDQDSGRISKTIEGEEKRFANTLEIGNRQLVSLLVQLLQDSLGSFFKQNPTASQVLKMDVDIHGRSVSGLNHDKARKFIHGNSPSEKILNLDELTKLAFLV